MHNGRPGAGATPSSVPDAANSGNAGLHSSPDVWRRFRQSGFVVVAGAKILRVVCAAPQPYCRSFYRDRSAAGAYSTNQFVELGNTEEELNRRSQRSQRKFYLRDLCDLLLKFFSPVVNAKG